METSTSPPVAALARRQCAESCLEYLIIELVNHYRSQLQGPPLQAAVDAVGFRVGQQLAERYTRERAPMLEPLDVMKFVCKELWMEVFRKSVDNLRTNHRGTFVLRDTQFRWLGRLGQNLVGQVPRLGANELAADYLVLPCAIVRGALAALGLDAAVTADATAAPQCDFTVVVRSQHR